MRLKARIYEFLLKGCGEDKRFSFHREFLQSQFLSADEIRRLQLARLQKLVKHAYENCEFYRSRFTNSGFNHANFGSPELSLIPALTKTEIQNHQGAIVASNWPRADLFRNYTGGSTGQPLQLFYDGSRCESRIAATMRHDEWAGRRLGCRVAYIWGAPTDFPRDSFRTRIRRWFEGPQLWLNTGNLRISDFAEFNRRLMEFRPSVILGYANSLALFAQFVSENKLPTCSPKSIISSAEILSTESRDLIERTFCCPVFNRYGCREVSVIASECEHHDGMHIMAEGLYVEVVDRNGQPVPDGETGDILVTDLLNYGMPLIRYRIGDRGALAVGKCPCGRGLPRLKSIAGRVTDFIVGADKQLVSGVFLATYVIAQRPSLGRVQIVQSRLGDVLFRVCPGKDFNLDKDRDYLFTEMRKYVGPLTMDIKLVKEIPQERSGKLLFCKSEVTSECIVASNSARPG